MNRPVYSAFVCLCILYNMYMVQDGIIILLLLLWQSHVCSSAVAYVRIHVYNIIYYSCWFPPAGPSPGGCKRGQWLRARARVVPIYYYYFLCDRPTARTPSERRQLRRHHRRRSGRSDYRSRYGSSAGDTLEPVWPTSQPKSLSK